MAAVKDCGETDSAAGPREYDYTEDEFLADLKKASSPLEAMAKRARESLKNGTGIKFPA
jgi:hypothetical protein